jgi:hypothetical protein
LGATRFFHQRWPDGGLRFSALKPLWEPFLKEGVAAKDDPSSVLGAPDNQLASVFARLRLPHHGAEVHAEIGREDHSWDRMDLLAEPDHNSFVSLGSSIELHAADGSRWFANGEFFNGRTTHLTRVRYQGLPYEHLNGMPDGHTLRGQLLGNPFLRGGGGAVVGIVRYSDGGRTTVDLLRMGLAQNSEGGAGFGTVSMLKASGLRFSKERDYMWTLGMAVRLNPVGGQALYSSHLGVGLTTGW